ncbi:MAG: PLDc N-terminal domain-containing protein [Bacteroidetes bacterium]|nr:PLDc N-terminal domain-containing protein [Bacteroidota bacterium]
MLKKPTQYTISLAGSLLVYIVAALYKVMYWPGANVLFSAGVILGLPFVYLGIIDVYQNTKREPLVKLLWTLGFIFLSVITGIVYQSTYQKRNRE